MVLGLFKRAEKVEWRMPKGQDYGFIGLDPAGMDLEPLLARERMRMSPEAYRKFEEGLRRVVGVPAVRGPDLSKVLVAESVLSNMPGGGVRLKHVKARLVARTYGTSQMEIESLTMALEVVFPNGRRVEVEREFRGVTVVLSGKLEVEYDPVRHGMIMRSMDLAGSLMGMVKLVESKADKVKGLWEWARS